jgi:hypothetical protein
LEKMMGTDMYRLRVASPQPEQMPEAAQSFRQITLQGVIRQPISSKKYRKEQHGSGTIAIPLPPQCCRS